MSIEVQHVNKRFGDFQALNDVNLHIAQGELIALLGPSGCGKTTLLRIIAGLETPDSGQILFSGEDSTDVHVRERQVGFVFQHYALFRHMTVFDNVAFGLKIRPRSERPSKADIREKVHALLKLVQLDWLADRYPSQLSGGQRQRIALARALAVEPKVLLLDEPFGALDAKVRKELRRWLRRLHEELNVTSIFVTHDQEEALEVADRVVVINRGRIEQSGSPLDVWQRPASPFVYGFLGDANRFQGTARDGEIQLGEYTFHAPSSLHAAAGDSASAPASAALPATGEADAFIRPHDFVISRPSPGHHGISALFSRAVVIGAVAKLELLARAETVGMAPTAGAGAGIAVIEAQLPAQQFLDLQLQENEEVLLSPRRARVFVGDRTIDIGSPATAES
ncbi:sulfate ABC transporter ATP-binding protein [Robbsia sp. KACC 23696]|uniref:sulfate/molybdate ABC transporter ATP-binding protein n=1 Tax=Robbsia sp. KACC 23696 TaxID=3149231 RepID=UPI00325AA0C2